MTSTGRAVCAVASRRDGPFTVAVLTGELQHYTAAGVLARLRAALDGQDPPVHLVLDLTDVGFLDSGGVHVIARTWTELRGAAGTLRVVAPEGSRPRRVLRLTGLDTAVSVHADLAGALAS